MCDHDTEPILSWTDLHQPQCLFPIYFYFGSKESFSSSDNVVEVGEGFICISRTVKMVPISFYREVILCGNGRSFVVKEDYHPQCVSLYLVEAGGGAHFHHQCVSTLGGVGERGGGSTFALSMECLPLP